MARIHSRSEYLAVAAANPDPGTSPFAAARDLPHVRHESTPRSAGLSLGRRRASEVRQSSDDTVRRVVDPPDRRVQRLAWPPGTARRRSATSARPPGTAADRADAHRCRHSGCRALSSSSSGWIDPQLSSRRRTSPRRWAAASPLATTSIAHPSSVAAAPTPTNWVLPTARSRKNALASTISTMPTVNTNSARPRRVRFECRTPAHDTRRQREQHVEQRQQPRQRACRRTRGCAADTPRAPSPAARPAVKNATRSPTAMSGATRVLHHRDSPHGRRACARRRRRDHHATACRAGDQRAPGSAPIEMFGQRSSVSISSVSGCQFSAATIPRLPSARIIAALTRDCLLTSAQPMRRPVASPRRPAITQMINQTPLRAGPARSRSGRTAAGRVGR